MSLTYATACKAVADVFREKPGIKRVQVFDELTESIVDMPLVQVYPYSGSVDARNTNDRTTFSAVVRQTEFVIRADGYARRRSHINQDLKAQIDLIDAMDAALCAVTTPLFGQAGIKGFSWKWERVTLAYGNTQEVGGGGTREVYAGCEFTITLLIY